MSDYNKQLKEELDQTRKEMDELLQTHERDSRLHRRQISQLKQANKLLKQEIADLKDAVNCPSQRQRFKQRNNSHFIREKRTFSNLSQKTVESFKSRGMSNHSFGRHTRAR